MSDTDESDDECPTNCEVPEGAIVACVFEVCGFLNPDTGKLEYSVRVQGDTAISSILGLVEMAKFDVHEKRGEWDAEEGET